MKGTGIKFSYMMRKSIVRGSLFLMAFLLVLGGCKERDLRFKIRYDTAQGLEKGGRVVFLGGQIGEVSHISDTENGYLVEVSIKEKYRDTVTEHARFFVVEDPDRQGKRAIQMIAPHRPHQNSNNFPPIDRPTTSTHALTHQESAA